MTAEHLTAWQRDRLRKAGVGTVRHKIVAERVDRLAVLAYELDEAAKQGWRLVGPVTSASCDGDIHVVATMTRTDIEAP